jgi:carboxyl-terminal processing protease
MHFFPRRYVSSIANQIRFAATVRRPDLIGYIFGFFLIFLTCPGANAQDEANKATDTQQKTEEYRSLETLARGLFYLENLYVDPDRVKKNDMVFHALQGIVEHLDPHTIVMPSKAFKQLTIDTQGKFGGVGIIVSTERGRLIVVAPIEGTPADRAGIKSGDEIVAIDDVPLKEIKRGAATERMRGKPNTDIKLSIKRKGVDEILHFNLTRKIIKIKSVKSRDLGKQVLYTRITSFQDNTADELKETLTTHKGQIKGLILDLRDNPGGLLDQAVRVSDMFLESGLIVSTVGRSREDVEREFATKRGSFTGFPIVVLINGGSASASEIVAGALQDHERALILGTTSFGKGSVQTLVSLPDHSGLKITVARYYTPKDRSIQAKGIKPDVVVRHHPSDDKKTESDNAKKRKESDLKGHIKSDNLSDLANQSGIRTEVQEWAEPLQKDNQLVTAYTYLRGWGIFKKKREPTHQDI